jgi:hypothetical protein
MATAISIERSFQVWLAFKNASAQFAPITTAQSGPEGARPDLGRDRPESIGNEMAI